ncbi:13365_t:CDS:2, partial [Funneliformis mosseae]
DLKDWSINRRLLTQTLMSTGFLRGTIQLVEKNCDELFQYWDLLGVSANDNRTVIELPKWMKAFSNDLIIETILSKKSYAKANYLNRITDNKKLDIPQNLLKQSGEIIDNLSASLKGGMFIMNVPGYIRRSIFKYFNNKIIGLFYEVEEVFDKRVKERRQEIEAMPVETELPWDLLTLMITTNTSRDQNKVRLGEPLSDISIRKIIMELIVAGTYNIMSSISFVLAYLCNHPNVKDRLIEEIEQVYGVNSSPTITFESLDKLRYCEAVIHETARISPTNEVFFRTSSNQVELCGYTFEPDTLFWTNFYKTRANEAADPIDVIKNRVKEAVIADVYDYVQYNKKTCGALVTTVEDVKFMIRGLIRQKEENIEEIFSQNYYNSFCKLINCLNQIKKFFNDISQLSGFASSSNIKETFEKIIKDLDSCSIHLKLARSITNEQLISILSSEMKKFLDNIEGGITIMMNHTTVLHVQERKIVVKVDNIERDDKINKQNNEPLKYKADKDKHELNFTSLNGEIDTIRYLNERSLNVRSSTFKTESSTGGQIEPSELKDTAEPYKRKVTVLKKIYKQKDVACRPTHRDKLDNMHLAILRKLKACSYIIRFYGLSKLDVGDVMVFEWAECGTLRELYQKYTIEWDAKISFARSIFCGLIFLHAVRADTSQIGDLNATIHWLAPEKLKDDKT